MHAQVRIMLCRLSKTGNNGKVQIREAPRGGLSSEELFKGRCCDQECLGQLSMTHQKVWDMAVSMGLLFADTCPVPTRQGHGHGTLL
jgi:hypothetical protein